MEHVVVVGNGIAGTTAATTLRDHGFRGRITMIGAETHEPYSRPALSKSVLAEEGSFSSHLLPPADHGAEVLRGVSATGLDLATQRLQLSNGSICDFDGLVIACGIRPRKLRADLNLELTYRNVEDAETLREQLRCKPRVVVVGAGVLGMDLASACAAAGCRVTVVCRSQPMRSSLGPYLANVVANAAVRQGVKIVNPEAVDIRLSTSEPGAREVVLGDKSTVVADLVITAIGDVPNTEWLENSGLLNEGDLRVDSRGRLTSNVVAAGDVASIPSEQGYARVPLWTSAIEQAKVAARALLHGDDAPELNFQQYFWTDQFGLAIKACGPLPVHGEPGYRTGDPAVEPAILRWQNDDGTGTAVSLNVRMAMPKLRVLSRQVPATT